LPNPEKNRTSWILARRPPRAAPLDPMEPRAAFAEDERLADGTVARTGVILLTNRECPWKCVMCDLWKSTTVERVPAGAIPAQIQSALRKLPGPFPRQLKLYNSGSFFDAAAIPPEDYAAIAELAAPAENVVVESHPLLVGERTWRLRDLLRGSLEVALGLETVHPGVLRKLNKGFEPDDFARAAEQLKREGVALRVFLLVHPPFMDRAAAADWCQQSVAFAFDCGASVTALIPTREGNGAMEALRESGEFMPPSLCDLEEAQSRALAQPRGRVLADTWEMASDDPSACEHCRPERIARLQRINVSQCDEPRLACPQCGAR
jgi:hypothetical protein